MKERLLQLLDLEHLTPSKFADLIGVQRSSVSHVISGRNNPSYDFLQKTLRAFPGLHAEWLLLGEGTMYEQMGRTDTGDLFSPADEAPNTDSEENLTEEVLVDPQISDSEQDDQAENKASEDTQVSEKKADNSTERPVKRVVQVMIFYEDNTFQSFDRSQ